jgi:hypothetical protein
LPLGWVFRVDFQVLVSRVSHFLGVGGDWLAVEVVAACRGRAPALTL